jgi:hypothetical protein
MSTLWKMPDQDAAQRALRLELAGNVDQMLKILEIWEEASQDSLQKVGKA